MDDPLAKACPDCGAIAGASCADTFGLEPVCDVSPGYVMTWFVHPARLQDA